MSIEEIPSVVAVDVAVVGIIDGVGVADVGGVFTSIRVDVGLRVLTDITVVADIVLVGVDSGTDELDGGTTGTYIMH